ncbi:unnamed protein product [Allacma fusca]|uniref:CRAL-TRIO domain-containing protein n=1 Tax=Allacma fusca TaxID=39272 RepID=A0A8J2J0E5_9HEXA|nr:unnamed protein product [Allacma fusca]
MSRVYHLWLFITLYFLGPHGRVEGQILPEEVPDSLQHLLHWDLDTWQAPEEIQQDFPYFVSGFDEENRPILVLEFGKWDIRKIVDRGIEWERILDKYIDQIIWNLYNSTGLRSTPENRVNEVEAIIDMDGYGFKQLSSLKAVSFTLRKMRLVTIAMRFANSVFMINTNFIAESLLNLLKPIMGKEFEKIQIFGTNPKHWMPRMLKVIPRDQLPPKYGGSTDFSPVSMFG